MKPQDPYRAHKLGALLSALLLTVFAGYAQFHAAPPAPTPAPPSAPPAPVAPPPAAAAKKKPLKKKLAAAPVKHARGERLREKGEALLGGRASLEKADAEKEEQ